MGRAGRSGEMADALDSESSGHHARGGSSPLFGILKAD
jgi:hypothetical protein